MSPKKRNKTSDTIEFFPHEYNLSTVSPIDLTSYAALQLSENLKSLPWLHELLLPTDDHINALTKLTHIFYNCIPKN